MIKGIENNTPIESNQLIHLFIHPFNHLDLLYIAYSSSVVECRTQVELVSERTGLPEGEM